MILNSRSGYTKTCVHYDLVSKEDYHTICLERVNAFVVENKRIMNPIDELDKDCYFLWIKKSGKMVACVRVVPPHLAYTYKDRQYTIWDKGWITDSYVSLFPIKAWADAKAYVFTPEWGKRVVGVDHAIMDMYPQGHQFLKFFSQEQPGITFLGKEIDEYGYDGYKWVYEPTPLDQARPIIRNFIESQQHKQDKV